MPVTTYRTVKTTADTSPYPGGTNAFGAGAAVLLSADGWKREYNITLNSFQIRQGRIEFQVSDALPAAELSTMPYFQVV
jgi:hypothetical protein